MPANKRVLFIAYAFPPVGGAGVQRTVKFVKHLNRFGWDASVLTVANPSVPVRDEGMLADVPSNTLIRYARTYEPSYATKAMVSAGEHEAGGGWRRCKRALRGGGRRLANLLLQPDPQILWLPQAIKEGAALLRQVEHHAIVATAPPFSAFLIGANLAGRFGLPLVLDYRDEWDISNAYSENRRPDVLSQKVQWRMQRYVVRKASLLLATTHASARSLEQVRMKAGADTQVAHIYNGYDPDDFGSPSRANGVNTARIMDRGPSVYRLAYIGTLWELTSVAPLVEAIRALAATAPNMASRLELLFVGRQTAGQKKLLQGLANLPCRVLERSYIAHDEAIDLLRTADGLCVLLSDLPGAQRVMPAKVFECMAARRPILVIAPHGELWDVLRDYPYKHLCLPIDIAAIKRALLTELQHKQSVAPLEFSGWSAERFSRHNQAGQLAGHLDGLWAGPSQMNGRLPT